MKGQSLIIYSKQADNLIWYISYNRVHILHFVYSFNVDKLICCIKSDFPIYLKDLIHDANLKYIYMSLNWSINNPQIGSFCVYHLCLIFFNFVIFYVWSGAFLPGIWH